MDLPGSPYRLAQCFPLAVGLCPGTGASGRDGGRRWELGEGRCGNVVHLPAPTTGAGPHEQHRFWTPQTGHIDMTAVISVLSHSTASSAGISSRTAGRMQ